VKDKLAHAALALRTRATFLALASQGTECGITVDRLNAATS
jgi:hypothetical protein